MEEKYLFHNRGNTLASVGFLLHFLSMIDNKLKSYDFSLPKELIAQKPTAKRSSSR